MVFQQYYIHSVRIDKVQICTAHLQGFFVVAKLRYKTLIYRTENIIHILQTVEEAFQHIILELNLLLSWHLHNFSIIFHIHAKIAAI